MTHTHALRSYRNVSLLGVVRRKAAIYDLFCAQNVFHSIARVIYIAYTWTTLYITSPLLSFSIYIIHICVCLRVRMRLHERVYVYFITRRSFALYTILSHAIVCMNTPCLHASLGPVLPCTRVVIVSSYAYTIYNVYDLFAAAQCMPRVFAAIIQ